MTPEHIVRGSTFLTAAPPLGLGLTYRLIGDIVRAEFTVGAGQEGPPGHAHGGLLAALLDEAMGAAAWHSGKRVVAVHLDFDFRHPVPVGSTVTVRGWVERLEGRKVFTRGAIILSDERTATEGTGIFVEAPQFFSKPGFAFESGDQPEPSKHSEGSQHQV